MKESVEAYQKLYPNITVKTVLQPVDTYNTLQKTACKAGSGPDIWYNWGGTWSLELAWTGCTVPNEDVLAAEDLKPVPAIEGTRWGGKTWIYPFELRMFPVVYNKELFKKAGLDRRIQHFHKGRNDNGECDEPRIDDPRGRQFDSR